MGVDVHWTGVGPSIFVTTNHFLLMLYRMGVKMYSKIDYYFRAVETLEAAHEMAVSPDVPYVHPPAP